MATHMSIHFTQNDFHRLCYLPYNTILTSFLAHGVDFKGMRDEQEAEVEHRKEKLRSHPELHQLGWSLFNQWVGSSERGFISQLEEGVAAGKVIPATAATSFEPVAWYICMLDAPMLGKWKAMPVEPHWLERPKAIGIVVKT